MIDNELAGGDLVAARFCRSSLPWRELWPRRSGTGTAPVGAEGTDDRGSVAPSDRWCPRRLSSSTIGTSVLSVGAAVELIGGAEFIEGEGCEVVRQSDTSCFGPIHVAPEVCLRYTYLGSSIDHLQRDTGVLRPPALGSGVKGRAQERTQPSRRPPPAAGAYDSQLRFASAHDWMLPVSEHLRHLDGTPNGSELRALGVLSMCDRLDR